MKAALIALALLATPASAATYLVDISQGVLSTSDDHSAEIWKYSASIPPLLLTQGNPGITHIDFVFSAPLVVPLPPLPDPIWLLTFMGASIETTGTGDLLWWGTSVNGIFAPGHAWDWSADTPITIMSLDVQSLADGGQSTVTGFTIEIHQDIFTNTVPEPATWALLLFGFAFFALKGIWPGGHA